MTQRKKIGIGESSYATSLRVGFFLATRQVLRGNIWTSVLIVVIMMFTFLNLVVVSGILVGLIEGTVMNVKEHYTGDLIISKLKQKSYIENSNYITQLADNMPEIESYSARYLEGGSVRSDYKIIRKPGELEEIVSTVMAGINPENEEKVTELSSKLIKGSYLEKGDYDKVLIGSLLLKEYMGFESEIIPSLTGVDIGSRIQVNLAGNIREVTIKGILKSKVDEIDRRIFFVDSQFRNLINRFDYNIDEISIRLKPGVDPVMIKSKFLNAGAGQYAKVQTQEDAEPKFVKDLKKTFAILGNIISSIGLVVASITIFIVVFINAITRRKFIGILKGIGIHSIALEFAYMIQAVFYAILGTVLGSALVFGFLKPYFSENPIDYPFGDGILVATTEGTLTRIAILLIATIIAGYIPARMVAKQNTLDAILGR